MKKLLMGILGLILLLPIGVNANGPDIYPALDGNYSTSKDVTVGNVEVPVYSVDVIWNNPTFDWVYDQSTGEYSWKPAPVCEVYDVGVEIDGKVLSADELIEMGNLYTNDTCSTNAEEYQDERAYFYIHAPEYYAFGIEDLSENGRIVPSVKWSSNENYEYVEGKFSYIEENFQCNELNEEQFQWAKNINVEIYDDASCSNNVETSEYVKNKYYAYYYTSQLVELTGEELPNSARVAQMGNMFIETPKYRNYYLLKLKLENKTKPTTTPTAGDTLGTLTISIRADE